MGRTGKAVGLAALWVGLAGPLQAQTYRPADEPPPTRGWTYKPGMRDFHAPRAAGCDSSVADHARENYLHVVRARSNNFENIRPSALGLTSLPFGEERARVVREFVNTQMQTLMGCSNEALNRAAHDALRDARSGGYRNDEGRFAVTIMRERPDWVASYFSNAALTRLTEFVLHNRGLNPTPAQREAIVNNVLGERETLVPQLVRKFVIEAMRGVEFQTDAEGIIYGIASAHMSNGMPSAPQAGNNNTANNAAAAPSSEECRQFHREAVDANIRVYETLDPDFSKLTKKDLGVQELPASAAERKNLLINKTDSDLAPVTKDPATCGLIKSARAGDQKAYDQIKNRFLSSPGALGMSAEDFRNGLEDSLTEELGRPLNAKEKASLANFMENNAAAISEIAARLMVDIAILRHDPGTALLKAFEYFEGVVRVAPPIELDAPAMTI